MSGGCIYSLQGDLPDVEVTQHDLAMPGVPATNGIETSVAVPIAFKPARLGLPGTSLAAVDVLEVILTARDGIADFSFIRALRITVTSAEAAAAGIGPVEIARYAPSEDEATGSVLRIPADPPADVRDVWRSDRAVMLIEIAGQLPSRRWTLDLGVRLHATLQ
jgi:hypothetical protein